MFLSSLGMAWHDRYPPFEERIPHCFGLLFLLSYRSKNLAKKD
jgi:hypothetical protein